VKVYLLAAVMLMAACMQAPEETAIQTTTTITIPATTQPPLSTTSTIPQQSDEQPSDDDETTLVIDAPADTSGCDSAKDTDECLYQLAGKTQNTWVCSQITDENLALKCRARLIHSGQYCQAIDNTNDRDYCHWMMAFKWNQKKYCDIITQPTVRERCIVNYLMYRQPDPFQCFNLAITAEKDRCILYHIGLYSETDGKNGIAPSLCNLIQNKTMEKECENKYSN
jgi:hypothetical protein